MVDGFGRPTERRFVRVLLQALPPPEVVEQVVLLSERNDEEAGELYTPSTRPYRGLTDVTYPFHDWTAMVTHCGRLCFDRRKVNLSQVFAGQQVCVRQVTDRIWLVSFMEYDLGYFDDETCRLEPIQNPFGAKLLPMSPE